MQKPITARESLRLLMMPFIGAGAIAYAAYVHKSVVFLIFAIILSVGCLAAFVITIVVFRRRSRERHG